MENQAIVSPLIGYFENQGLIKPFAGYEGVKAKAVILDWPAAPQAGDKIFFQSDSRLDGENAVITEIEVVDQTTQNVVLTNPRKDNLADTILANGWLVLSNLDQEEICMVPLNSLIRRLNSGKPTFFNVDKQVWQNCYVCFSNTSGLSASNALTLRVCYLDKVKD